MLHVEVQEIRDRDEAVLHLRADARGLLRAVRWAALRGLSAQAGPSEAAKASRKPLSANPVRTDKKAGLVHRTDHSAGSRRSSPTRGLEHSQGLRLLSLPRRPTPGRDKGTKHEAKTQHPQVPDLQGFPTATCCCRLFVSANVRQDLGPRSVSLQESRNRRKNASRAIATETKAQPRGSQRLCQLGRAWPLPHHLTTCAAAGSSEGHPREPGCASLLERCPQVF